VIRIQPGLANQELADGALLAAIVTIKNFGKPFINYLSYSKSRFTYCKHLGSGQQIM
jgi:hypothetical protein